MSEDRFSDHVGALYEAAAVPELWAGVCGDLAEETDGVLGSLFVMRDQIVRWTGNEPAMRLIEDYIALNQPELNSRVIQGDKFTADGFATDHDIFTDRQLANDPFYRDFLYPRGYGWVAATRFESPNGDRLYFSVERKFERGPFEPDRVAYLNRLRPHLARASLLSARLGLQRAQAMADALETIGLPCAVLRGPGRLYAANPLLQNYVPHVLADRQARVTLAYEDADRLLEQALLSLSTATLGHGPVQSIPLPAHDSVCPLIVHVLPIRGAAHDIFSQATALLIITPVDRQIVPTAAVLQGLFDLTPAEARVARAITEGRTLAEIAAATAISEQTLRSQLKVVMAKTGVKRQANLVALLTGRAFPTN
jgi:DNA-binding CsgD family transcriptional regulator